MSVWKDRKGRYHVAVQRGGVRVHRICPEASTWRQAKDKESELLNRFQAVKSGKVLIADAIQHWLKEEVAHHKAKRGTEGHAYALALWIRGRTLQDIVSVAEAYKNEHRALVTNSTVNRRLAVTNAVRSTQEQSTQSPAQAARSIPFVHGEKEKSPSYATQRLSGVSESPRSNCA